MQGPVQNSKNTKYLVLLLALLVFHLANNLIILSNDNTPLLWDGGDYFYKSLRYYDVIKELGPDFFSKFNDISRYRPPLLLLSSQPLYLIFGKSTDVASMTNILFMAILMFSVYGIGRRIQSRETGLLAAFVITLFPLIFGMSRSYWQDFPLTAMVSLSIYLLIRTNFFANRKFSILFGVSVGLGMLTKWTHFVFLSGVFLLIFFLALKPDGDIDCKPGGLGKNLFFAVLAAIGVSSFWYIPNGWSIAVKLFNLSTGITGEEATRFQQLGETIGPSGIFNVKALCYNAAKLVNEQIGFFFAFFFMIFTLYLFKNQRTNKWFWLLILWVVIPLICFTLIKNKTPRNTIPMLPAIGILISFGVMNIKTSFIRKAVTTLILLVGFLNYMVISYGSSILPQRLAFDFSGGSIVFFEQYMNPSHAIFRANKGDWKADEILERINNDRGDREDIEIIQLPRDAFTWMAMEYTSYLNRMPFTFIGAVDSPEAVLDADYVLMKKGGFVAPWFLMENVHRALDLMEDHSQEFSLLTSVILPEERMFLPVYDIKATRKKRREEVIFSDKIQIIDYTITEEHEEKGKNVTVTVTVKGVENIDDELMVVLKTLNKKMELLLKKGIQPNVPLSGLKVGEVRKFQVSVTVPFAMIKEFFSLEMGFYDKAAGNLLKYKPEYLIYKRRPS